MRIAIDAMGGDNAPQAIVAGAIRAASELDQVNLVLYGDEAKVNELLGEKPNNIEVVATSQVIQGDDEPVRSVRRKKDASMVRAARDVKDGKANALISAGNTGALLIAGTLIIGRIKGLDRPALMGTLPSLYSDKVFQLMDLGANADCKPLNLDQFAVLGSYYAKNMRGVDQPKVALLNNGTEDSKGNDLSKSAFELLSKNQAIDFIGNIEAKEILQAPADVIVTDGFTGNAVLKSMEGTAKAVIDQIKSTIKSGSVKTKLGGFLIKKDLSSLKDLLDYSKIGGAVLFGTRAPVIKTHGSANAEALYHTVKQARDIIDSQAIQALSQYFEQEKIKWKFSNL